MRNAMWLALPVALSLCIGLWFIFKPVRIIAPELAGVTCLTGTLCTDDPSRVNEASTLQAEALRFVEASLENFQSPPRLLFCSTDACAQSFGLGRRSAITVGSFGIVIGPRAWEPHYVRHEMIHHLQNEKMGLLNAWRAPEWFKEGMAYALSGDPRSELTQPFEGYRARFKTWYAHTGKAALWEAASKL